MDRLTIVFAFLTTLSLATERITETIKGLPVLSKLLAVEKTAEWAEELRKAAVHIIAIAVGTLLAALVSPEIQASMNVQTGFWIWVMFGAMASGGSGLWNSALDIVREVNHQKQAVTKALQSGDVLPEGMRKA